MKKLVIVALLLTGCANTAPMVRPDVLMVDRGELGLWWGGFASWMTTVCAKNLPANTEACADFKAQDPIMRKRITTPPMIVAPSQGQQLDMDAAMKLFMSLGKMAL